MLRFSSTIGEPRPLFLHKMRQMGDRQKLIGGPEPPVKYKGISFVATIWILLTFAVMAGLVVAGGLSYWLGNRIEGAPSSAQSFDLTGTGNNQHSALVQVDLGLYYLCYHLYSNSPSLQCGADTSVCNGTCRELRYCGCATYLSYDPPSMFNASDGNSIPSSVFGPKSVMDFAWLFAASIIYAMGVLLLLVSLVVGVIAFFKPRVGSCSLFLTAFVFQIIAGERARFNVWNI